RVKHENDVLICCTFTQIPQAPPRLPDRPQTNTTTWPPLHTPKLNAPLPGTVHRTIHCDRSFKKYSQMASHGLFISNTDGHITDGRAGSFLCNSAIVAEATALLHSMNQAASSGIPTIIKTDCLAIVTAINSPKHRWTWSCLRLPGENINEPYHCYVQAPVQRPESRFYCKASPQGNSPPQLATKYRVREWSG
ncbi:hypothetical protein LINGRAHAP2_LOCUS32921, partial [Linum grandiflorum]